jgi:hypothetical protein
LLSHPFPFTRDTQQFAYKYKLSKSRYLALRNLTAQEFGIQIQGGEHSSVSLIRCAQRVSSVRTYVSVQVTDARATMAIYRLHRREWEKGKDTPVTIGPLPNTEETETVGRESRQRSTRRREERYKHRAHDDCQMFEPLKNKKYVIDGVEKKSRVVVGTGVVFERFTTADIEFLACI